MKKEQNKIVIWADTQMSWWSNKENEEKKEIKLYEVWNVIFWSAWSAEEANIVKLYFQHSQPKQITNEIECLEFIRTIIDWWKKYWIWDKLENQYLFIIDKKIRYLYEWFIKEVDNYYAIGSWMYLAMAVLDNWLSIEQALKSTCKYDMFCSEPLNIKTVNL